MNKPDSKLEVSAEETDHARWSARVRETLYAILRPICATDASCNRLLAPEFMPIWETALTHDTYDSQNNYERLEYLGDAVLKFVFPLYLSRAYPQFTNHNLTLLNNAYMSRDHQVAFSKKLGLVELVRTAVPGFFPYPAQGDIFESMFGALNEVGDKITPATGSIYCYNLIINLYQESEITVDHGMGANKTQVTQSFSRFGLDVPEETVSVSKKGNTSTTTITVSLTRQQMAWLKKHKFKISNPIIGKGSGPTIIVASLNAYIAAGQTLMRLGYTHEFVSTLRRTKELESLRQPQLVEQAIAKVKREGYVSLEFYSPSKMQSSSKYLLQLRAITRDGTVQPLANVLCRVVDEDSRYEERNTNSIALLQSYVDAPDETQ
jgi:dsRNA-specific ribonuclease